MRIIRAYYMKINRHTETGREYLQLIDLRKDWDLLECIKNSYNS